MAYRCVKNTNRECDGCGACKDHEEFDEEYYEALEEAREKKYERFCEARFARRGP